MNIKNLENAEIVGAFLKLIKQIEHDIDVAADKKEKTKNMYRLKQIKNVVKILSNYDQKITSGEQLEDIKGIGAGTVKRINEILKKGKLSEVLVGKKQDDIDKQINELQEVIGIGRKTAHELVMVHKIKSVNELEKAYRNKKITLNDNILMGLKYHGVYKQQIPRSEMVEIDKYLHKISVSVDHKILLVICGSYRRLQMTSNDIDCMLVHPSVVTKDDMSKLRNYLNLFVHKLIDIGFIVDSLTSPDSITKYMGFCKLDKKSDIRRIDIRYVPYESYYTALLYFTGSGEFNQKMRSLAIDLGYTLNEYHLYKIKENKDLEKVDIVSEEHIFEILGMEYVTPDKRK